MLKITKIIALILCISLASVFAHEAEMKFLMDQESETLDLENQTMDQETQTHEHEEVYPDGLEKEPIERVADFSPKNAEEFVLGYLSGVELFNDVATNSTCLVNAEVIVEDSFKLYNILKDLKVDTQIITHVKEIIETTQSIVSHMKQEDVQCKAAAEIAMNDLKRVAERVGRDGYVKELATHTWNNIGAIEEMVRNGFENYHGGNMHESGRHFGRATKFVGFWDL
jgi:hypothetical protein